MGVYVKDEEKPKDCWDCFNYNCKHWGTRGYGYAETDCPLIGIVQCKDCKWFELDVWGELNGIPLIVAHEMCKFWGNGCKTNPNGFCSYGERRADDNTD